MTNRITNVILGCALFAMLLVILVLLTGCAAKKHYTISAARQYHITFRGVKDGSCEVDHTELDARTGNQVIVCK